MTKTKEGVEDVQTKRDLGTAYGDLGKKTFELADAGELDQPRVRGARREDQGPEGEARGRRGRARGRGDRVGYAGGAAGDAGLEELRAGAAAGRRFPPPAPCSFRPIGGAMARILLATDGSPSAAKAAEEAVRLARATGWPLTIVTAWHIPVTGFAYDPLVVVDDLIESVRAERDPGARDGGRGGPRRRRRARDEARRRSAGGSDLRARRDPGGDDDRDRLARLGRRAPAAVRQRLLGGAPPRTVLGARRPRRQRGRGGGRRARDARAARGRSTSAGTSSSGPRAPSRTGAAARGRA